MLFQCEGRFAKLQPLYFVRRSFCVHRLMSCCEWECCSLVDEDAFCFLRLLQGTLSFNENYFADVLFCLKKRGQICLEQMC